MCPVIAGTSLPFWKKEATLLARWEDRGLEPRLVQSHTQSGTKLTFPFLSSPAEVGANLESKSRPSALFPKRGLLWARPTDPARALLVYFFSPK